MLLPRLVLERPRTLEEASALLAERGDDAALYAGGTELLLALKLRVLRHGCLVDLKRIPGLAGVAEDAGGALALGALATHRALERDPLVRRRLPAYAALSADVGNVRVRVAGTLGGNLAFAEPHADPPTLLAALGARVRLVGPDGSRECAVGDFVTGAYQTARGPAEILAAVVVPPVPPGAGVGYARFAWLERPTAAAAVMLEPAGAARIGAARVWVGAVGPRPVRVEAVEAALRGCAVVDLDDALAAGAERAAAALAVDADLHGSADYKRHLAAVLVRRAVRAAAARLGGPDGR